MMSAVLASAIRRPFPITMRWSAVRAISLMRWLETNTVRPSAARRRSRVRIHRMPSGSRPFTGSSHSRTGGSPSSAAASPRRWLMPSENAPARRGDVGQADRLQHLVDPPPADAVALRHAQQVVAGTAPAVHRAYLQHRPHLVQRAADLAVRRARSPSRCRHSAGPARRSSASWSTCPRRSGPGTPSPAPAAP